MERVCQFCGVTFDWVSTHPRGGGKPRKYCGSRCRSRAQHDNARKRGYISPKNHIGQCEMCGRETRGTHRESVPKRCDDCKVIPSSTPLPEDHWALWYGKSSQWAAPIVRPSFVAGRCVQCGVAFIAQWHHQARAWKFCSRICGKRHDRAIRRALRRGAYVADVRRSDIFMRDEWRCHMCKRKVSKVRQVPHPRAATIDHLIPLAKGGTHEPANVATACFECNCIKSDGAANDQLMLVG